LSKKWLVISSQDLRIQSYDFWIYNYNARVILG
jgi:hypothetical protein